jgi:hypothetical protein
MAGGGEFFAIAVAHHPAGFVGAGETVAFDGFGHDLAF